MRILLVEDNAELVSLVIKGLQRGGFAAPLFNVVGGTAAWVAAGYATET